MSDLTRNNPRLIELEAAYRASPHFDTLLKGSAWETFERGINLQQFRGEAQYLTQMLFGSTPEKYRNTFDYARTIDTEGYLEQLGEDGAFGCITLEFDGVTVSRDLLDSVMEIYFLKETLGLTNDSAHSIIDIGAGYGRFAHRWRQAFPNHYIYALDAVPVSTFLCEFYLNEHRYLPPSSDRWGYSWTIPLDSLRDTYYKPIDLACNIHSWSECTLSAIDFWLDYISDLKVPYLFVVPHDLRWVACEPDGSHPSFKPTIEAHGYRLVRERPKFPTGVDGIHSEAIYCLFERG